METGHSGQIFTRFRLGRSIYVPSDAGKLPIPPIGSSPLDKFHSSSQIFAGVSMQTAYLIKPVLALFAVIGVAGLAVSPSASADDKDEGWVSLFNGKDLSGWKIPNPPSGQFKDVKEVKNS